jgi:hypothetical protein
LVLSLSKRAFTRFFISSVILNADVELASSFWIVKDEPIPAGDNVGDESIPEAIVILDTTVMQRLMTILKSQEIMKLYF